MRADRWYLHETPSADAHWALYVDGTPLNTYQDFDSDSPVTSHLEEWLERGRFDLALSLDGIGGGKAQILFPARIGHVLESATVSPLNLKLYANVALANGVNGKLVRNYHVFDSAPRMRIPVGKGRQPVREYVPLLTWEYTDMPVKKRYVQGDFSLTESISINRWLTATTHRHDVILLPDDPANPGESLDQPDRYSVLRYPFDGNPKFPIMGADYSMDMNIMLPRPFVVNAHRDEILPTPMELSECRVATCARNGTHMCGACHAALYCSKKCQRADWPLHQQKCKEKRGAEEGKKEGKK